MNFLMLYCILIFPLSILNFNFIVDNDTTFYFKKDEKFSNRLEISKTCLEAGYLIPDAYSTSNQEKFNFEIFPALVNLCEYSPKDFDVLSLIDGRLYIKNQSLENHQKTSHLTRNVILVNNSATINGDNQDESLRVLYRLDQKPQSKYIHNDKMTIQIRLKFIINYNEINSKYFSKSSSFHYFEEIIAIVNLFNYQDIHTVIKIKDILKTNNSFSYREDEILFLQSEFEKSSDTDVFVFVKCQNETDNYECDYSVRNSICTKRAIIFINICEAKSTVEVSYRLYRLIDNILFGGFARNRYSLRKRMNDCFYHQTVKPSVLCGNGVVDRGEECDCSFSKELCNFFEPECNLKTCLKHSLKTCNNFPKLIELSVSNMTRENLCRRFLDSDFASEASSKCYDQRKADICQSNPNCTSKNSYCMNILCHNSYNEIPCENYILFRITNEQYGLCHDLRIGQNKITSNINDEILKNRTSLRVDVIVVTGAILIILIIILPVIIFFKKRLFNRKSDWSGNDGQSMDFWSGNNQRYKFVTCHNYIEDVLYSDFSQLASETNNKAIKCDNSKMKVIEENDLFQVFNQKNIEKYQLLPASIFYNDNYEDRSLTSVT